MGFINLSKQNLQLDELRKQIEQQTNEKKIQLLKDIETFKRKSYFSTDVTHAVILCVSWLFAGVFGLGALVGGFFLGAALLPFSIYIPLYILGLVAIGVPAGVGIGLGVGAVVAHLVLSCIETFYEKAWLEEFPLKYQEFQCRLENLYNDDFTKALEMEDEINDEDSNAHQDGYDRPKLIIPVSKFSKSRNELKPDDAVSTSVVVRQNFFTEQAVTKQECATFQTQNIECTLSSG